MIPFGIPLGHMPSYPWASYPSVEKDVSEIPKGSRQTVTRQCTCNSVTVVTLLPSVTPGGQLTTSVPPQCLAHVVSWVSTHARVSSLLFFSCTKGSEGAPHPLLTNYL